VSISLSDDRCSAWTSKIANNNLFRQPPLYYALGALAISWVDIEQELPLMSNPYLFSEGGSGGHNAVVHTSE
jgi:hypothetical protein